MNGPTCGAISSCGYSATAEGGPPRVSVAAVGRRHLDRNHGPRAHQRTAPPAIDSPLCSLIQQGGSYEEESRPAARGHLSRHSRPHAPRELQLPRPRHRYGRPRPRRGRAGDRGSVSDGPRVERALLNHYLAAIAYRTQKAIRDAPAGYWQFSAGHQARTPIAILRHMTRLLGY